jgi:hypothetical protein
MVLIFWLSKIESAVLYNRYLVLVLLSVFLAISDTHPCCSNLFEYQSAAPFPPQWAVESDEVTFSVLDHQIKYHMPLEIDREQRRTSITYSSPFPRPPEGRLNFAGLQERMKYGHRIKRNRNMSPRFLSSYLEAVVEKAKLAMENPGK